MAFRFDKLTLKAQEAVARAQELATDRGHAQIDPLHLLAALLAENDGIVGPILDRIGVNRGQLDKIVQAELGHFAHVSGGAQPQLSQELNRVLGGGPTRGRRDERRVRLDRTPAAGADESRLEGQKRPETQRRHRQRTAEGVAGRPRQHPRDRPKPGREVPGVAALRHRPGRARAARKARSGDRPRPGNPPRHASALPPDEEQPRADRRAGRGQDGHRRRARPADRRGRRARKPQKQAADRARHGRAGGRHEVSAASSRSG